MVVEHGANAVGGLVGCFMGGGGGPNAQEVLFNAVLGSGTEEDVINTAGVGRGIGCVLGGLEKRVGATVFW